MNFILEFMPEHTRYINPLVDFSFRKIFGSDPNKDILIAFLNEIFRGRKRIVDLVYNKNEHDGENEEEARAVFDLLCTGDQGEIFYEGLGYTYLDLPNFVKTEENVLARWTAGFTG